MGRLDIDLAIRDAVRAIHRRLGETDVEWALTGSASFALQGAPVEPDDVDVQTTAAGAHAIEDRFADAVVEPVAFSESTTIRSHFGAFDVGGVRVEVMGHLQKRVDGEWEPPADVADHRKYAPLGDAEIPVLSLSYEARAYELPGRSERAALLREHVD